MSRRRTWDLAKGFVGSMLGITSTEFWVLEIVGSRGDESPNLNIDLLMIRKLFSIVGEVPRVCSEGAQPGPEPFERWQSWHSLNRVKNCCSVLFQQQE